MSELPSGRVTFLFTDIEGSTRLVQGLGSELYGELLSRHSEILREAVSAHGGIEFGSEGDAHFFVFRGAADALRAAVDAQRSLGGVAWPTDGSLRVRMGVHSGTPELTGGNYVGVDLSRVARITAAGHGGQILSSETAQAETRERSAPVRFVDLGQHRLKDLAEPEHMYQVVAPDLMVEFPPIRTIDTRPKQLPAQVASFIGRGEELSEVKDLLARHRLVTLTGPGGSGKTRLAIAVADRVLPAFEDGVFFVPLAPVRDAEIVALTVASVLGVREAPERPVRAALNDHLKSRELLLALDNFEHLLEASSLVAELLAEAPRLRVLVTSRILLRLYGEREFSVPPLPLPAVDASLGQLAANPAVALFVDRAAAVSSGFRLTAENARIVADICRRVDGLPLAVELAAARMRILSPAELATRLDHRLSALVGGAQDVPDRQRTLRGTIQWSYELLDPAQRALFARLSVFDGGWTAEAAEGVAGGDLADDALYVLERLVEQSLVRSVTRDEERRFEMLETIREFAAERLSETGEAETLAARHAAFFAGLAKLAEPRLTSAAAGVWVARLQLEVDNVRAALRWSLAADQAAADQDRLDLGMRLAGAIWRFWQHVGALREGREWLEALLTRTAAFPPSAARGYALLAAAGIAYWQNDFQATVRLYEETAEVAKAVRDRRLLAEALDAEIYVGLFMKDLPRTRRAASRAAALWLELGDEFRAALATANAAYLGFFEGSYAGAIAPMEAMIEQARRAGERYWLVNGLTGLGQLHRMLGNVPAARGYYAEALTLALEDGNLALLTMALEPAANLETKAGRHEDAVRLWGASDAIKERIGGGAPAVEMRVVDPRAEAIAAIGEERVERAYRDGRAMTAQEAVRQVASAAGREAVEASSD